MEHQLFHREIHDPAPALDTIVDDGIRPRLAYLSDIVARMIGCDPSQEAVLRTVASIQAQAIAYLPNPIAARLGFVQTHAGADQPGRGCIARFFVASVYRKSAGRSASHQIRRFESNTMTLDTKLSRRSAGRETQMCDAKWDLGSQTEKQGQRRETDCEE